MLDYGTPVKRRDEAAFQPCYGRVKWTGATYLHPSHPQMPSVLIEWWLPNSRRFLSGDWMLKTDIIELPRHYEIIWDDIS